MTYAADISPTGMIRGALNSRFDQALSALTSRSAHSWMMALDRAKVLPDANGVGSVQGLASGAEAVRLFIRSGAGARVTDMDGTSYLDMSLGGGAQILGHAHPVVQQAIVSQSARGWHFDLPADGQLELARLIQNAGAANERVALCNSGSGAASAAAMMSRAFTGKSGIAVFTGSFHGRGDSEQATAVLPYGHPAALDQIRRRRGDLAAVFVEPVRASDPNLDRAAWLQDLSITCREAGVLLIFDERKSGFRLAYGGAQEVFGLMPDLVIYGKTIGGGLPLGAVAGRADVLATPAKSPAQSGANRGQVLSPLSVTAGTATLAYLLANRTTLYPALNDAGRALAEQVNAFARNERLPVEMRCAGSMFRISFGATPLGSAQNNELADAFRTADAAFNVLVLSRGVMTLPGHRGFVSAAHTGADIESVRDALTQSLVDLRDDGLFGQA